jgi:aldose 1-epimerase
MSPPVAPPGWPASANLLRLVAADGSTVAWVSAEHGANCLGFAVHNEAGWQQIFDSGSPELVRQFPTRYGCPLLFPFPGYLRGGRYAWAGTSYQLPANIPGRNGDFVHGFAHNRPWQVRSHNKQQVRLELATDRDLTADERAGYPFNIRVELTITLQAGQLQFELLATNRGPFAAPVGLGLHPYLTAALWPLAREAIPITWPGTHERDMHGPYPTGAQHAASASVQAAPFGQSGLLARSGLQTGDQATIGAQPQVQLTFGGAFCELALFSPAEQASISPEPLTCPLSAASQPAGHPDGLRPLQPGRSLLATLLVTSNE